MSSASKSLLDSLEFPDIRKLRPLQFLAELLGIVAVYIVSFVAALLVVVPVVGVDGSESTAALTVISAIAAAVLCSTIYGLLRLRKQTFNWFGLRKFSGSTVGYSLIGYGAYLVAVIVVITLLSALIPGFTTDQEQSVGFGGAQGASLLLVFISLVVLPPLTEELLLRGYGYAVLKQVAPKWLAGLAVSVVFGLLHFQLVDDGSLFIWPLVVDTFILSVVGLYLLEKTGSLWPAILVHGIKNAAAFTLLFIVDV